MTLSYPTFYRLVRQRQVMAAEIPASDPQRRAWVAVYPLHQAVGFAIRAFEVDRAHLEHGYDLGEDDLFNLQVVGPVSEADLEPQLRTWLGDRHHLVVPWRCDFPL